MRAKLIVIEGTDGSGKATITKALAEVMTRNSLRVATLSFPRYGNPSAEKVEKYLRGELGDPMAIPPQEASLFYAEDRSLSREGLKRLLEENDVVILDRFVDSNAAHQGSKIGDEKERRKFVDWLYDLEYRKNQLPRPHLVIILHVPHLIAFDLIAKKKTRDYTRGKNRDRHEEDREHLRKTESAYLWLAKEYPERHLVIECMDNSRLFNPAEITEKIIEILRSKRLI